MRIYTKSLKRNVLIKTLVCDRFYYILLISGLNNLLLPFPDLGEVRIKSIVALIFYTYLTLAKLYPLFICLSFKWRVWGLFNNI